MDLAPCHSQLGDGNGMIVQRGFRAPPSYHTERLRKAPLGYFFDVMTNGFGAMPLAAGGWERHDCAARVPRAAVLSHRAIAQSTAGILLRCYDQWIWRHAGLRCADPGAGPLEYRGL